MPVNVEFEHATSNMLSTECNVAFERCHMDAKQQCMPIVDLEFQPLSLSTVVLNSRDWLEIVWLPKISRFKNQPCNRLYLKKPTGMHWLGYYDAVSWLNKAKT